MKTLVLLALFTFGCEHDPRFEKHVEQRPEPAAAAQPTIAPTPLVEKTIERPVVTPKFVPLHKRTHHHHH
jgi:hypothetical protein